MLNILWHILHLPVLLKYYLLQAALQCSPDAGDGGSQPPLVQQVHPVQHLSKQAS